MPTFVMLSRLAPEALKSPKSLEKLGREAMDRVRKECPEVKWLTNYAVTGPYDYLDVFEAPNLETAAKLSALIRTFGHAQTEIWGAIEWSRFKEVIEGLVGGANG